MGDSVDGSHRSCRADATGSLHWERFGKLWSLKNRSVDVDRFLLAEVGDVLVLEDDQRLLVDHVGRRLCRLESSLAECAYLVHRLLGR